MEYRKIPIISPGLMLVQKAFFVGLIFVGGGGYFRRGLLSEAILRFSVSHFHVWLVNENS